MVGTLALIAAPYVHFATIDNRNMRIVGFRVRAKWRAPRMTASPYPSAATSFVALSSSTFTSSLRLAGGNSATPSWRGITCMCR